MVEIIIVGLAIAGNFIILKMKWNRKRYQDLAMDLTVLFTLSWMFGGTILGMAAAMVGGLLVSIYLFFAHKELDKDDIYANKPKYRKEPKVKINW